MYKGNSVQIFKYRNTSSLKGAAQAIRCVQEIRCSKVRSIMGKEVAPSTMDERVVDGRAPVTTRRCEE